MIQKEKKKVFKLVFSQIAVFIFGLVILVLISIPLARNVSQRYKINQEIKDLESEIQGLEKQNSGLKDFVEYLGSEQFVEEQARLNLGLKKQGEEVAVVKNGDGKEAASQNKQTETNNFFDVKIVQETKKISNPVKWRNYFFKY